MKRRVVVVGAGPGGLAIAVLLARAGIDVTVLERRGQVGGRTSALEADGFRFDTGPTFFLFPRVLEEIFAAAGRDLHAEVELLRLDPQYRLVFGSGGALTATPDVAGMEREIGAIAPEDARHFRRFLADNRSKMTSFEPILDRPFESWRDLLRPDLLKLLPRLHPGRSLERELGRYFRDPRIRLAFSFQSKYLGMSPFRCPSLFSILSFLEYEHGVFHPRGGCAAITEALARVFRDLGGSIHLDEPVEGFVFKGRRATAVCTRQRTYPADGVVLNADFAQAMESLVPDRLRRRWTDRRIARKKFSCSTYMMYLGIEGRYDDVAHHTIYMAGDYQRNLEDIESRHILSEDPSFYVQNPCVTDTTLAPAGRSTLYVLIPVTHQHANVDWQRERDRYRAVAYRQLAKIGLGDVERRVRFEKIVTPADWQRDHAIHRGATFNLAHNLTQMLHLRPHNRFEDLDGVYLVGGGTHPGSGLPVIFKSAQISARLVLEDLLVATHPTSTPAPLPQPLALAEAT